MEEPGSTLLALGEGEGWSFAEGRSDQVLTRFEALVADPHQGLWPPRAQSDHSGSYPAAALL